MSNIITEISPGEVVEFVVTLDVDASVLERLCLTVMQICGKTITKTLPDGVPDGNTVTFELTRIDTLSLQSEILTEAQVSGQILGGLPFTSGIVEIKVNRILRGCKA